MLAYYGLKAGWPPLYACLADYPVEAGDAFFFCLSFDQMKDGEQRMIDHAKQKAEELLRSLRQ